jgi:hypothetical protein
MRAGLVGYEGGAARSYVCVSLADALLIVRREIVADGKGRTIEFEDGVAIVAAAVGGVEGAIAGRDIEVTFGIDCGAGVAEPDTGLHAVGIHIKDRLLRERLGVIGHDPAVIGIDVA